MRRREWITVVLLFVTGLWLAPAISAYASGENNANASSIVPVGFKQIGLIDFSNWQSGSWYTYEMMSKEWNPRLMNGDEPITFMGIIHNRAIVAENKVFSAGKALRVFLPKDRFSPLETGAQIFGYIGGQEAVYFRTSIYLPPNFECGREIKIPPGIYGGWKLGTGGMTPDGIKIGPSVRADLQKCQLKSYVYHLNQSGDNGDGTSSHNPLYGDKFSWKFPDGKPVVMTKGVRHDIMFFAGMNTPGKKDGVHQVWYDGKLVLSIQNLEFRKSLSLQFDTIGSEIFRGGNDQSFAAATDNTMEVGDFMVYVK